MKILVVDDDRVALNLLAATLKKLGHDPITAENGEQAWELLSQHPIRLVITDWYMPKMDGIELCKKIRANGLISDAYIYCILLTSHDQKQDILTGLSSGADDYIAKPFDPAELNLRVRIGERIISLETRDVTLFALAKLAEHRHPETGQHLERMRNYCKILAVQLGKTDKYQTIATPEFIRLIYLTSPLHDIGKVGIPDKVLMKPGKLTDEEWVIMKTHAEKGAETLGAALEEFPGIQFLEVARDIAWCHHEKHDGTGYPRGLKGEKIPLAGRVVALADVYDALTNKRVYKPAFDHENARKIILEGDGTHFHPDIVLAFRAAEEEFLETRKSYMK